MNSQRNDTGEYNSDDDYENESEIQDLHDHLQQSATRPASLATVHSHNRTSAVSTTSNISYCSNSSGFISGGSRPPSSSFMNCQKKAKQIPQQPRQPIENASDDDSDYVEPDDDHYETLPEDDQIAVRRPPEKKPVVSVPEHAVLRQQKPRTSEDRDINTIRITAIRNNLRPTVIPAKHQTKADDKKTELAATFNKILSASKKTSVQPPTAGRQPQDQKTFEMTSDQQNRSSPASDCTRAGKQPLTVKPSKPLYANCPDGSTAVPMKLPVSPKPFSRSMSQTASPSPPSSGSPTDKKSPQIVPLQASWTSKSNSSSRRLSEPGTELAIPQLISPTRKKPPPLETGPRSPVSKSSVPTPAPPSQVAMRKKTDSPAAQSEKAERGSSSTAWSMPTPLTFNQCSTGNPSLQASSSFTLSPDEDFPPDLPPPRPEQQPSTGIPCAYVLPTVSVGDALSSQPWYFGNLGRTASEEKMARFRGTDGTFLVRRRESEKENPYSITVVCNRQVKHVLIRERKDKLYAIGNLKKNEKKFASVTELISFYRNNSIELAEENQLVNLTSSPPR